MKDRFHLKRALNQVLDNSLAVLQLKDMKPAQWDSSPEQAKEVGRLRGYLIENAFGLRDYRMK